MNKLGRNKTLWLKNQKCVFKKLRQSKEAYTEIFTEYGEYIGLADLGKYEREVNFIYRHRLTNLMSINRAKGLPLCKCGCNAVSIGFNEKEQQWYGWTHRGFGRFGIGYEVVKGSICDYGTHEYPFKVKTLEEAKQLAIDIAEYLN
jgi:hypothetical protein